MAKLFAVLLGGRAEGCNAELHDVVFVVGDTLEETYPKLVHKWFGLPHRLHVDASVALEVVDGHEVRISEYPPATPQEKKLFFVNFGGYRAGYFGEVHEVNFYVATSKEEALAKAKQHLGLSLQQPHCDDNLEVEPLLAGESDIDDILELDSVDRYYLELVPTQENTPLDIQAYYRKINLAAMNAPVGAG